MRPSTDVVLSALKKQFPALEPRTLVPFGEGMDFYAYELDGDTIVRVPRRQEVAAHLAAEYRLLRLLGRRMRIGIPKPTLLGSPDRELRFSFIGYPKIGGSSALRLHIVPDRSLARQLGTLLATLHRVTRRTVTRIGIGIISVEQSLGEALTHARIDIRYLILLCHKMICLRPDPAPGAAG